MASRPRYRGAIRALLAFGLGLGMSTALARPAAAFCRTTTCEDCIQPANGCVQEGLKLFWGTDCVSYDLQQDASLQVSLATATDIAARAFAHWQTAKCSAAGATPAIEFLDRGPVACGRAEFNDPNAKDDPRVGGNANIIVFRDDNWDGTKASDPTSTLALTTVTFYPPTGEIFDADIEINSEKTLSTGASVSAEGYDLESILTHEIGHFIGLAHSPCLTGTACPTMHASYVRGATDFRSLEPDDMAGVCEIYPPGRKVPASACVPFRGFGNDCGRAKVAPGCSVAIPERGGGYGAWGFAAASVAVAVMGCRLRARRGRPSRAA